MAFSGRLVTMNAAVKSTNRILGMKGFSLSYSIDAMSLVINHKKFKTPLKSTKIIANFSSTTSSSSPPSPSPSSSVTQRSFRILGVQQLAIGGLDKAALTSFWVNFYDWHYTSFLCRKMFKYTV